MKVVLTSPHTLDEDAARCSYCLEPLANWERYGPCKPIIFYLKQDGMTGIITAKSPQLKIEAESHSTKHLQPEIMKAMDGFFNRLDLSVLGDLGLQLPLDLDPKTIAPNAKWDVPYQTRWQR